MIMVIFGVAEYDRPKVYEAGFIPRGLLRGASLKKIDDFILVKAPADCGWVWPRKDLL